MENKFTPGPWKLKTGSSALGDTGDSISFAIVENDQGHCICECFEHRSIDDEQQEANALLISEAPATLKILIELVDDLEDECLQSSMNDTIQRAKNQIQKATT